MKGIYLHIPFCRQACRYCDFYFIVSLVYRDQFVRALKNELISRKGEAEGCHFDSVYFGGGTPSVLTGRDLDEILSVLKNEYNIHPDAEITIEANPEDLDENTINILKRNRFNRLSIGIQSFYDEHLKLMRRSHNADQAERCIQAAAKAGFSNLSIDLIYGLPGLSLNEWKETLNKAMELPINHLSAYHLTYEPGTVFMHWKKKGRINELPEQESIDQYNLLREITAKNKFEHYEISNFSKPGQRSRHNSIYWEGVPYMGFGPSAHSFNGISRRWNNPRIKQYLQLAGEESGYFEKEVLTENDRYNEYLLTRLRTSDGINLQEMVTNFGEKAVDLFLTNVNPFLVGGDMKREGGRVKITEDGWLKTDHILPRLI